MSRATALRRGRGPDTAVALAAGTLPPASADQEQADPAAPGGRRRWLWVSIACGAVAVILLAGGVAVAWHFSSVLLVPDREWHANVEIRAVEAQRIVLDHSDDADRPGVYGLVWKGGHAIVGPILSSDESSVTRSLRDVDGYLVPGVDADLDSDVFQGDPGATRGLPFSTVKIDGELGPMPAWEVPAAGRPRGGGDWAIVLHGLNGTQREGLRLAPALRQAGLTSLLITYRDDLGAPSSPDGLHHLGMTEWRDLQAAARYALAHGARRLVLVGYSMGGAIATQFMEKSKLAPRVVALVLDAPVLDWRGVLEFNTTETGFPAVAANPLEWVVGARIDVDWDSLDALAQTDEFRLPILLFHSTDDDSIPIEDSEEFAEELPRWVTFYKVPRAAHTQSWNVNPPLYERRLRRFLAGALTNEKSPISRSGS